MSWLRRSSAGAEALPEPAPPPEPPPPAEHPAAGLREAVEHLPRPGASVLDLGPALAANVAFFNGIGARLRIADLDDAVDEAGLREVSAAVWERRVGELARFRDDERFDLVLAWDLPNYFGRERWPAVAALLIPRLTANGCLHLLARVGAEMPADPCRYRIVDAGTISEEVTAIETLPAPRFPHAEVEKLHPGLVAPRSHLGKHGVQEFLLEPAAAHDLPPRRVAQARKNQRRSGAIRIPPPLPSARS